MSTDKINIQNIDFPEQPPNSAVQRRWGNEPAEELEVTETLEDVGGISTDDVGRIDLPGELDSVETVHEETAISVFVKLKIVTDEQRAKALVTLLRGKTPQSVIKTREGRGGKKFSYVESWYVKKMLNALFAMQWDFELVPIKEGEMFYMNSMQVMVLGKLTVRDTDGKPRIVKMGVGKKEISYIKGKDGARTSIPVDLGNEIKSAESDALKRCATGLGIALDLYSKEG